MSLLLLENFSSAWNAHDVEALVSMVTDDCTFDAASGIDVHGHRVVGKVALRKAFPAAWQKWPDARWVDARHWVSGQRGVSEWTFMGTDQDGHLTEVRGVDLLEFENGLIARKDTYRKNRTSPST